MNASQWLVRRIAPHGKWRRVLHGPAKGMKFMIEPGIGFSYWLGREGAAPSIFNLHIVPGSVVYDVGANKGQMALLFAALTGPTGRVIAIEPAPAEYKSLEQNVHANHLGHVRTIKAAAAQSGGTACFAYAADAPTQGKLRGIATDKHHSGITEYLVSTITLDSLLATELPPSFIKIDVEGAAAVVLEGSSAILANHRPTLYIELHGPEEQTAVRDILQAHHYTFHNMHGEIVEDPALHPHYSLWCRPPSIPDLPMFS